MDCSQYASCPTPPPNPPDGFLPVTGLELVVILGFAVACVALGLLIRFSERDA
jgi:hypothetical protein